MKMTNILIEFIIGYFTIKEVTDFNELSEETTPKYCKLYSNNAHIKRKIGFKDLVIIKGYEDKSKLLDNAILISETKLNKAGRLYHAVSKKMEKKLGIKGSIQRSIPPRIIENPEYVENLKKIINWIKFMRMWLILKEKVQIFLLFIDKTNDKKG